MATRNRALIAAKRSLDRQSWGGRKGRFAVQRTLEHLKQCAVVLNDDVKAIKLNLRPPESKNQGAKHFFFENVPQLRYHNPNVQITRTNNRLGDAALWICFANGREEQILTEEKTNLQILNELAKLASSNWSECLVGSASASNLYFKHNLPRILPSGDSFVSPDGTTREPVVAKLDNASPNTSES